MENSLGLQVFKRKLQAVNETEGHEYNSLKLFEQRLLLGCY